MNGGKETLQHLSEANKALVEEWLNCVENDSENVRRVMGSIADDCVWVIEPGGFEYRGAEQIRAFVAVSMSGRRHDKGQHRVNLTNWFADNENLCYEYTHGFLLTGRYVHGIRGSVRAGVLRYCITCHLRDGKFDRIHEYINSTSWWVAWAMQFFLAIIYRQAMRQLKRTQRLRR
jgi:uncharacterized protein YggL (DUF469 family)